jgi:hypothetical protein
LLSILVSPQIVRRRFGTHYPTIQRFQVNPSSLLPMLDTRHQEQSPIKSTYHPDIDFKLRYQAGDEGRCPRLGTLAWISKQRTANRYAHLTRFTHY